MGMPTCTLAAVAAWTIALGANGSDAAPRRLDCVLTDTPTKPQSENRPIVVVFDVDVGSLTADEDNHTRRFGNVSISSATINGQDDEISVGIDRSSLGIVWQQYNAGKVHTEYGFCHPSKPPT
jgi:hypothetical protein